MYEVPAMIPTRKRDVAAHNPITLERRFDKKVWSIRHRSRLLSNQIKENADTMQPHDGLVFCGFYEALGIFLPLVGDGEIIEENCIDRKIVYVDLWGICTFCGD